MREICNLPFLNFRENMYKNCMKSIICTRRTVLNLILCGITSDQHVHLNVDF